MKICVRLFSNPLRISEELSIQYDPFQFVGDLKSQIYPETPNKFKMIYFEDHVLSDDKTLTFYKISKDAELEISIQNEFLINFLHLKATYEIIIDTNKEYSFKTLLQTFKDLYNLTDYKVSYITPLKEDMIIWSSNFENHCIIHIKIEEISGDKVMVDEGKEEKYSFINTQANSLLEQNTFRQNSYKEFEEEKICDPVIKNMEKQQIEQISKIQGLKKYYIEYIEKNIGPLVTQKNQLHYLELINIVREDKVTIMVTGQASAGKTSFLNLLISCFLKKWDNLLPTFKRENTAFIWNISKSEDERMSIGFHEKTDNFKLNESMKIIDRINEINEMQFIALSSQNDLLDIVEIKLPNFPDGLRLIDSPGYSNPKIFQKISDFLQTQIVHCFIIKNINDPISIDYFFEEMIKEAKKAYNKTDFYLIFSRKDEYFNDYVRNNKVLSCNSPGLKMEISHLIKRVHQHFNSMEKINLTPHHIYCLNNTAHEDSLKRLLNDINHLLSDSYPLVFNLKNFLSNIQNLFKKESDEDFNYFYNNQSKFQEILKIRKEISDDFCKRLIDFFDILCQEESEQRIKLKKKIEEKSLELRNFKNKEKFMNEIMHSLEKELSEYLVESVQTISNMLFEDFLNGLEKIAGKKYVSDVLCISEKHLSKISENNYGYDLKTFMCLVLDESYSKLYIFEKIRGLFNRLVSWGYDFQEKGLFWSWNGAEKELNSHLTKTFVLQKDVCLKDIVACFDSILEKICKKFESFQIFDENYELVKYQINFLRNDIDKEFPEKKENLEKKGGLDLLEWNDLYPHELTNYENFFNEEKRKLWK